MLILGLSWHWVWRSLMQEDLCRASGRTNVPDVVWSLLCLFILLSPSSAVFGWSPKPINSTSERAHKSAPSTAGPLSLHLSVQIPVPSHSDAGRASGLVFLLLVLPCSDSPTWFPCCHHTRSPIQRKNVSLVPLMIHTFTVSWLPPEWCSKSLAGCMRPFMSYSSLTSAASVECPVLPPHRSPFFEHTLLVQAAMLVSMGFLLFIWDALAPTQWTTVRSSNPTSIVAWFMKPALTIADSFRPSFLCALLATCTYFHV